MKEISFINLNRLRWNAFENQMTQKHNLSADDLANHYILLTEDLSYARTFYPNSGLVDYLNNLSSQAHAIIYRNKKERGSRLIDFWIIELPLALYNARRDFFWSLFIFLGATILGIGGAIWDDKLVRLILGDSYVNMTLDNIARGDPLGVYGSSHPAVMFLQIGINNIKVSFVAFLLGVFTPLGTAFVLFRNGTMVGAFMTFFFQHDLGAVASLTVMLHGALELSAIVLAGGAGILLGRSILFPGTYPRKYSFVKGVRRGSKIMLGLIPFFILAAFIESYITRHYNTMPMLLSAAIVVFSLVLIVWYFIVYPKIVFNKLKLTQNGKN